MKLSTVIYSEFLGRVFIPGLTTFFILFGVVGKATAQPFAYVTNLGSNNVSVIATSTNTVVATVEVGSGPYGVAITPDGAFAYVTNNSSNDVSVIDIATNGVVATVGVGSSPVGVAITPDGAFAYVTNTGARNVSVIATSSNTVVATVGVGAQPFGIAITPDGAFAYVANQFSTNVSVIATSTNTVVATVGVGAQPLGIAITLDGAFAYVTSTVSNNVSVIATSTNTVVGTVALGTQPFGIAITPDGAFAYVTSTVSNNVSVIATSTNTVVATVALGTQPLGIAIAPDGAFAYVTNLGSNNVSVIATSTNTVVATVGVGTTPYGVAITPASVTAPPSYTPAGTDVVVQPVDPATGTSPVSLTFSEVTSGGETSLTISSGGPATPTGFKLGSPAVYFDISTTASFNPPVEVCINYTGIKFGGREENLNLSHFEDTDGDGISDKWVTLTTSSQDIVNNIICVSVASLSLFAIFEPLPGVIAGTVTVNGVGLAGVTVTLLDADELPPGVGIGGDIGDDEIDRIGPILTDPEGLYSFADLFPDDYQVLIVEPFGYVADLNPKPTTLASGATNTVDFALTVVDVSNEARSVGYWKHQFNVYVTYAGRGNAQETQEQLTAYIEAVQQVYTPHFPVFSRQTTNEHWQAVLAVKRNGTMIDRMRQQLGALVLNLVSLKIGQLEVVTADGRMVEDVLTFVSKLATDKDVSNDELAKDLAENVNTQQEIDAGIVPVGGILYKKAKGSIDWSIVPTEYALHNNYPNPFNPVTTISYDLPVVSDVKILIYNLMGQEVRRWDIQGQTVGYHQVTWDASNVSSGIYFYRLQAGDFVQTRKMVYLK